MAAWNLARAGVVILGTIAAATLSQSHASGTGPQSPSWFLQVQSQSADLSEQGAGEDGHLAACASDIIK